MLLVATLSTPSCLAFTQNSNSKRKARTSSLPYTAADTPTTTANNKNKPQWVPMELVELLSDDLHIDPHQFAQSYADVEAYTSCDDDGDDFHECDFFDQFLGPTKWLHLTPEAQRMAMHDHDEAIHFEMWKGVWEEPHGAVDLADKVSKDCLRYYKEFMLEPRSSGACPTDRPTVRVKVVPASFGLEGFEDALWEATEDLLKCSSTPGKEEGLRAANNGRPDDGCRAITFVVAAPDLFTDPTLLVEGGTLSPQAEFEPDRFREFASTLREKMAAFSRMEGVSLDDDVELTPFHPLWTSNGSGVELEGRRASAASFPYPCVAVSAEIEV